MIVTRQKQMLGIVLLVFVNFVWVTASEITRYLFIDLGFKRPFFFTYAKSCMLSLFLLYYCVWGKSTKRSKKSKKSGKAFYSRLNENENEQHSEEEEENDEEEGSYGTEDEEDGRNEDFLDATLTEAEFEPIGITDVESNTGGDLSATESQSNTDVQQQQQAKRKVSKRRKKVRFSRLAEVRHWPEKLEQLAQMARKPYSSASNSAEQLCTGGCTGGCTNMSNSTMLSYSLCFAPLWLLSSISYQTALAYSSVSSVNLISASSPLFVLMLCALLGRNNSADSFNWFKLVLVLMNLGGVCIVSRFSDSMFGSAISLFSAFANAVYLFVLSRISMREEEVHMPLMLGMVGIFSFIVCTPLMLVLHFTGIEPQLPLPSLRQTSVLVANSFLGTLFADSIWLYATLLTGSLLSALSGSLGIPLSMVADSTFRNQPPNFWQIISSIPIMISFVGASLLTSKSDATSSRTAVSAKDSDEQIDIGLPSTSAAIMRPAIKLEDKQVLLLDGGPDDGQDY